MPNEVLSGWDYTPVEYNPFDTPFASDEDVERNRELLLSKGTAGGDALAERIKTLPDRVKEKIKEDIMNLGRLLAGPPGGWAANEPSTYNDLLVFAPGEEDKVLDESSFGFSLEPYAYAMELAEQLAEGGTLFPRPKNALGTFGNDLALMADLDKRNAAKLILDAGGTNADARAQTGWFKAADKDLKFEISDAGSKFDVPLLQSMKKGDETELQTLLTHPELYANYPHLRYMKVFPDNESGYYGAYYPGQNKLSLVNDLTLYSPKDYNPHSTALHEVAHAIADFSGSSAKGANSTSPAALLAGAEAIKAYTDQIAVLKATLKSTLSSGGKSYSDWLRDLPKPTWRKLLQEQQQGNAGVFKEAFKKETGGIDTSEIQRKIAELTDKKLEATLQGMGYAGYRREAGEVEARNVQTRFLGGPLAKAKAPWETQEFPFEEQFIFLNDIPIPVGKIK